MTTLTATVTVSLDSVKSVYSGKAGKCACGCAGKHSYASAWRETAGKSRGYAVQDDEVSDRSVAAIFAKLSAAGAKFEDGHVWAEVGNRLYVAYLA